MSFQTSIKYVPSVFGEREKTNWKYIKSVKLVIQENGLRMNTASWWPCRFQVAYTQTSKYSFMTQWLKKWTDLLINLSWEGKISREKVQKVRNSTNCINSVVLNKESSQTANHKVYFSLILTINNKTWTLVDDDVNEVRYVSELRPLTGLLFITPIINKEEARMEKCWQMKTEELGEKLVPVPLCPPQVPHKLTQAQTWPPQWQASK
jgi:hypothetical protein